MRPTELPTFEATWWPVTLETVPGSGERIAIAVLARAASGQSQVRQLVSPAALTGMFGTAASGMRVLVLQTVASLQKQFDKGVAVEDLMVPFGGMAVGTPRDCVAHDFNEVFEVAFRLGGAFGVSTFGADTTPSDETRRAFDEWAESIRLALLRASADEAIGGAFNVAVTLGTGKRGRIGFLNQHYAANFGVLRPGRSTSSDTRALKVKLFDLEALKRSEVFRRDAELLVGAPTIEAGGPYSKREADTLAQSWEFIDFEAKQRGVRALRYPAAATAAAHLAEKVIHAR
jgi:hypothetical protein